MIGFLKALSFSALRMKVYSRAAGLSSLYLLVVDTIYEVNRDLKRPQIGEQLTDRNLRYVENGLYVTTIGPSMAIFALK